MTLKTATVTFGRVRDCPFWADGECLEESIQKDFKGCGCNEIDMPPPACPLKDAPESTNKQSAPCKICGEPTLLVQYCSNVECEGSHK